MYFDSNALEQTFSAAESAGKSVLEIFHSQDFKVENKSDNTPVTDADRTANKILQEYLPQIIDLPVISEEGSSFFESSPETFWLIDPIDGTKEFIAKSNEFTVNIALIHQNHPIAGVVLAPAMQKGWLAAIGLGAYQRAKGLTSPISTRSPDAKNRLKVGVSKSHLNEKTQRALLALKPHWKQIEQYPVGSSLKLCFIAEGTLDLYIRYGPTSQWDTAAAHAVLNIAGGDIINTQGEVLQYGQEEVLNPDFVAFGDSSIPWLKLMRS